MGCVSGGPCDARLPTSYQEGRVCLVAVGRWSGDGIPSARDASLGLVPEVTHSQASSPPARFLVRLEHNETTLLNKHGDQLDGVITLERFHKTDELTGRLEDAARGAGVPFLRDPDTRRTVFGQLGADTAIGRAKIPLPLTSGALESDEAILEIVKTTLATQIDVTHPAPPYFTVDRLDDPWLEINLRAAEVAAQIAVGQRIAVFLCVSMNALAQPIFGEVARRYAERVPGALIIFSVAGLDAEVASEETRVAYLDGVVALRRGGLSVLTDRVGYLAVAAAALGAEGTAAGTRGYRKTPVEPPDPDARRRAPSLKYVGPGRGAPVTLTKARGWVGTRYELPKCPVEGCTLEACEEAAFRRAHNAHLASHDLRTAQDEPVEKTIERLKGSSIKAVRGYGAALEIALRRAQAA